MKGGIKMQIQVSRDINRKVREASKILGLGEGEIVDRAILLYLDNIGKHMELKKEFKEWDQLSDEALRSFERGL